MAPPNVATCSVLLVEDDRGLRELYQSRLKAEGCSVNMVEDGLSALHILDVHKPDVIVLDLVLPRLSGRDVFREMRARPALRDIPVVVVSGTDVSDLDPADFAAILKKPVDGDVLAKAVNRAVRQSRRGP